METYLALDDQARDKKQKLQADAKNGSAAADAKRQVFIFWGASGVCTWGVLMAWCYYATSRVCKRRPVIVIKSMISFL